MAANLQLLKRRIKTAYNISQIAKAMQLIAASKIKKAQAAVKNNKPYAERITTFTKELLLAVPQKKFTHPYIKGSTSTQRLLIAISPDKGLCGSLKTNLIRKFLEEKKDDTLALTIGKKIETTAVRLGYKLIATFPMGTYFPFYGKIYPIIEIINEYYLKGIVSKVDVLYTEFVSIFNQRPLVTQLLPIPTTESSQDHRITSNYIFEPPTDTMLSSLLPHFLEVTMYHILIQAFTAEQGARMIAMQNAKNNAQDIATYLTLEYNRTRQERITSEILDLANGQQATL